MISNLLFANKIPFRSLLPIFLLCLVLAVVVFAVLPTDIEDVYTSTFSTAAFWRNILHLQNPFWLADLGFGVPLPLRFHFFQHPLSFLVTLLNPAIAIRIIECVHLLIGGIAFFCVARFFQVAPGVAATAAISFLLSSSILQPLMIDEWPSALVNSASLPVLMYCALKAISAEDNSKRWLWAATASLYAGVLVATTFPIVQAVEVGIVTWAYLFTMPAKRRLAGATTLAAIAAVALIIGGGQLITLWQQVQENSSHLRFDHPEPPKWLQLWSLLARPIGRLDWSDQWRLIDFGCPFGIAALVSLFTVWRRDLWAIKLLFVIGLVFCFDIVSLPFDLVTNNWSFRSSVNFAGLILASAAICKLQLQWPFAARLILTAQVLAVFLTGGWLVGSILAKYEVVARGVKAFNANYVSPAPDVPRRAGSPTRLLLTHEFEAKYPLSARAEIGLIYNIASLRDNVAVVNALTRGVTLDAFWPDEALLEGRIVAPPGALSNKDWLDVLGVRYILATPEETSAPQLLPSPVPQANGDLPRRLYINDQPWPRAVFLRLPVVISELPLLPQCPNQRALCRDLGALKHLRTEDFLSFEQEGGTICPSFAASSARTIYFLDRVRLGRMAGGLVRRCAS